MNNVEKIDNLYDRLQNDKLSHILPQVYNLALDYNDYIGFSVLWHFEKPLADNVQTNKEQRRGLVKTLGTRGLNAKKIAEIENTALEQYIALRYIDDKNMCSLSIKEVEDSIARCDELLKAVNLPDGLHPVDLYFRSETAEKEKIEILKSRQMLEKQYTLLQGYVLTQLTYYRSLALVAERKEEMNKGIKNSKLVFVIHGHSEAKLRELKELVTSFGLQPVILSEQPNQGMTVIEKFEEYASKCAYAFALFTPDDIVEGEDGNQYFQARPNVIFELGWFYSHLGRARVCILSQASEKNKIFSDLQGVMRVQFNKDISESYLPIKTELQSVGLI